MAEGLLVSNKLGPAWLVMKHLSNLEKAQQANFPSEDNLLVTGGPYSKFEFRVCSRPLYLLLATSFALNTAMPLCFCQVLRLGVLPGLSRTGMNGLHC